MYHITQSSLPRWFPLRSSRRSGKKPLLRSHQNRFLPCWILHPHQSCFLLRWTPPRSGMDRRYSHQSQLRLFHFQSQAFRSGSCSLYNHHTDLSHCTRMHPLCGKQFLCRHPDHFPDNYLHRQMPHALQQPPYQTDHLTALLCRYPQSKQSVLSSHHLDQKQAAYQQKYNQEA